MKRELKLERELTLTWLYRRNVDGITLMYSLLAGLSIALSTVDSKSTEKFIMMGSVFSIAAVSNNTLLKPPHGK
jgi:hypothetical protein